MREELEVSLWRGDGEVVRLAYKLDEDERTALLDEMRDYCQGQAGLSLEEFAASFKMGEPAGPRMRM